MKIETFFIILILMAIFGLGYMSYQLYDREKYCDSIGYEGYAGGQRSEGQYYVQCYRVDKIPTEEGYQLNSVVSDWIIMEENDS